MSRSYKFVRLLVPMLALWLAVMSCSLVRGIPVQQPGKLETETQTVDLNGASSVKARLEMNAGQMTVDSGAQQLLEATFTYNIPNWRPKVTYQVTNNKGQLVVNQPDYEPRNLYRDVKNTWDLRFIDNVPIDLDVSTGAGESILNLAGLDLNSLKMTSGAGKSTVDLTGDWSHDVAVTIEAGVGELDIKLPSQMGVRVEADTGIGGVQADGLHQDGSAYVNDAYGTAANNMNVNIQSGIGSVKLSVP